MTENIAQAASAKFKGRIYTFTVLHIYDNDLERITDNIVAAINKAPKLFNQTPVVIDCSDADESLIDIAALCKILRAKQLIPIGLQCKTAFLKKAASVTGLAIMNASTNFDKPVTKSKVAQPVGNKMVTTPVRSGQQIVCQNGDLIVTGSVSAGAELLASGNIHIYGTLRGRVLAGINGDTNARIFCQALDADLVSIAGSYRLNDTNEIIKHPCQVSLVDNNIVIEKI